MHCVIESGHYGINRGINIENPLLNNNSYGTTVDFTRRVRNKERELMVGRFSGVLKLQLRRRAATIGYKRTQSYLSVRLVVSPLEASGKAGRHMDLFANSDK